MWIETLYESVWRRPVNFKVARTKSYSDKLNYIISETIITIQGWYCDEYNDGKKILSGNNENYKMLEIDIRSMFLKKNLWHWF